MTSSAMAGRLVRLKAQMLLPRRSEEDGWEDPRAELVRRLLEYQQIREIAIWMGRAGERRAGTVSRSPSAGGDGDMIETKRPPAVDEVALAPRIAPPS